LFLASTGQLSCQRQSSVCAALEVSAAGWLRPGNEIREISEKGLESNRFPQILRQCIQRFSLSHDGQVAALGDEMALAFENVNLDNFRHAQETPTMRL
jgi:hypothetical protein